MYAYSLLHVCIFALSFLSMTPVFIVDETETETSLAEPFATSRSLPIALETSHMRDANCFHYSPDAAKQNQTVDNKTTLPKLANHGLMYQRSSFSTLSIYDIKRFMPDGHTLLQREPKDGGYETDPNSINEQGNMSNEIINQDNKDNRTENNINNGNSNHNYTVTNNHTEAMSTDEDNADPMEHMGKTQSKRVKKHVNDKTFIISRPIPTAQREISRIIEHKVPPTVSRPKLRKKSKSTLTPKTLKNRNNSKMNASFEQSATSANPAHVHRDGTFIQAESIVTDTTAPYKTIEQIEKTDTYALKLEDAHESLTPRRSKNNATAKKKKSSSNENTPRQLKKARILKKTSALLKTLETSPYLQGPIRKPSDLSAAVLAKIKKP